MTPGYISDLHFCVRSNKNKIMAIMLGSPKKIVVQGETVKMTEINFLAVHKALRGKKLG